MELLTIYDSIPIKYLVLFQDIDKYRYIVNQLGELRNLHHQVIEIMGADGNLIPFEFRKL